MWFKNASSSLKCETIFFNGAISTMKFKSVWNYRSATRCR